MIAALYVRADGPYAGRDDVDAWPAPMTGALFAVLERDARAYAGPWPVVAHPPCKRWGRYWHGGPSARERLTLGDDGGCFAAALASVRRWGGVIEHPEASHAWAAFGIARPARAGGWTSADAVGWTCCVEQGAYGHPARKATWLYAVGVDLATLAWRSTADHVRMDDGYHSAEERRRAVRTGAGRRLSHRQRELTPPAFADVLLDLARSVSR